MIHSFLCMCIRVCVCAVSECVQLHHKNAEACRGQNRALDPQELELQLVVSGSVSLGT